MTSETNNMNSSSGDSPKTPGDISKSFGTPIRRLGLTRNWVNRGSFISPLSNPIDAKPVCELKKRKLAAIEDGEQTIGEQTKTLLLTKDVPDEPENIPYSIADAIDCKNICDNTKVESNSPHVPLININKENKIESIINSDDDFQETKKVVKLQDKTPPISGLKQKKARKKSKQVKSIKLHTPLSQWSCVFEDDDDDDFVVAKKRTTLIKKSYDKPPKPLKVTSTGSITQKNIDEIKERIERKKKLSLVKPMTNESAKLGFIKKWQTSFQSTVRGLCESMKKDMQDKQYMDYTEILQILKIPPELVGYDSESPDDIDII